MGKLKRWIYDEYIRTERIAAPTVIKVRSFVFCSALAKTTIGLWLLNPWYNTFASSATYDIIAGQVTEFGLGLFLLLLGLSSFYSLIIGDNQIRIIVGYLSLLLYLYLATVFAIANVYGLAIPLWGTMAICEFINCTVFNIHVYKRYNPKEKIDGYP